jgi:rare lipoprotein A
MKDQGWCNDEQGTGALLPETILPSQFFDGSARCIEFRGERRLMLAILADAIHIYREARGKRRFREAERWIESRDRRWIFSFERICDILGFDAGCIRRSLHAERVQRDPLQLALGVGNVTDLQERRRHRIVRHSILASSLLIAVLFAAVAVSMTPTPAATVEPPAITGHASWYGGKSFGPRPTASGQRFDPDKLTAAHRTLPLGTRARVTNLRNGRSVLVTITDRGPYRAQCEIDVSYGAARALGMLHGGIALVRIEPCEC